MKKILYTAFFTISSFIGFGQDTLTYTNIDNLDMMIANIFGIQCDGVSNVQLTAIPDAIGRFETGSSIGVNSGIMMSTGIVTNSGIPSGAQNSVNLNMPGDVDIDIYGAQQGIPYQSYDATVIEFDFTPSVTDTIRFTYVFASEEYPEYVMQNYTDRFLFLVSRNGGDFENIAKLPNSSTTVEINTVNQYTNQQYFVDNQSGPTSGHFVFDGYTVPLEAKFFAQVDSSYHIKLVVADIQDGVYDSAIFLEEQESQNDIEGSLTVNGSPAEGILEVFNFVQGDTSLVDPIETIDVSNGTYLADSLPTGMYHVRFTPDPVAFPNATPMYFVNSDTWQSAQAIGLPCFLDEGDVNSTVLTNPNGNSGISGTISIDSTYLKTPIVAFENALVKLFNDQDDLVAFTYSDDQGRYSFENIIGGAYYIMLDAPYIPQEDVHTINLPSDETMDGVDFIIQDKIILPVDNQYLVGIEDHLATAITSIYPNPFHNNLTIFSSDNMKYKITDVKGRSILSDRVTKGNNLVSTSMLEQGIYFIVFENGKTEKLIKQ